MEYKPPTNAEARKAAPSELAQRVMARTSKGYRGPAILMLEDGTVFTAGRAAPPARRPARSASTPPLRGTSKC